MKLIASEIKIMNEGEQARKAIIEKFGSVKKFVEDTRINLSVNTVETYLAKGRITSDTLKYRLTTAFDKDYSALICDEEGQILRYVDLVYNNIKDYKDDSDIELMDRLRGICRGHGLQTGEAKMYRNTAMYHFYRGDCKPSIELLKLSVSILEGGCEDNLLIASLSELGLVYFYAQDHDRAKDIFKRIDILLKTTKNVEHKTLVLYYFRYGLLYSNMKKYLKAIELYKQSLYYSVEPYDIGSAIMGIGLTYKRNGNYKKAIGYFKKALESFENNDTRSKSIVYNNMAELYRILGKYDIAEKYMNMAMESADESDLQNYFVYFYTYSEIKLMQQKSNDILDKLLILMLKAEKSFVYRKYVTEGIDTLCKLAEKYADEDFFNKLELFMILHPEYQRTI